MSCHRLRRSSHLFAVSMISRDDKFKFILLAEFDHESDQLVKFFYGFDSSIHKSCMPNEITVGIIHYYEIKIIRMSYKFIIDLLRRNFWC